MQHGSVLTSILFLGKVLTLETAARWQSPSSFCHFRFFLLLWQSPRRQSNHARNLACCGLLKTPSTRIKNQHGSKTGLFPRTRFVTPAAAVLPSSADTISPGMALGECNLCASFCKLPMDPSDNVRMIQPSSLLLSVTPLSFFWWLALAGH